MELNLHPLSADSTVYFVCILRRWGLKALGMKKRVRFEDFNKLLKHEIDNKFHLRPNTFKSAKRVSCCFGGAGWLGLKISPVKSCF
jgi:hypothetical protein